MATNTPSYVGRINATYDRIAALRQCTPLQLVYLNRTHLLTVYAPGYQYPLAGLTGTELYDIIHDPATDKEIVWGSAEETDWCGYRVHPVTRSPIHTERPCTRTTIQEDLLEIGILPAADARRVIARMPSRIVRKMIETGCLSVDRNGNHMQDASAELIYRLIHGKGPRSCSLIWMRGTVDEKDLTHDDIEADRVSLEHLVDVCMG